jgi:uncharacterized protein
MGAERLNAVLRELREGVEGIYGERLVRLVLFGSQARNDAKPDSDIDVMVVLRGAVRDGEEIQRTSVLRAELCSQHLVVISCVYVSEEEFSRENSPLMLNVRREGVLV